jgi:hypothetical protein
VAAATLANLGFLPIASTFQLGDQVGLFELGHGTKDLTDKNGRRRVLEEMIGGVRGNQCDAQLSQIVVACQLDDQVASEPAGILDKHRADAIAGDPI